MSGLQMQGRMIDSGDETCQGIASLSPRQAGLFLVTWGEAQVRDTGKGILEIPSLIFASAIERIV